jgi:hypothetical protein
LLGKKCCGSGSEQPNNFFYSNPNADQPLLEMLMEILTLVGNLPRASCVVLSKAWGKKFHKCMGIFIIDAMVILPFIKISHEKNTFLVNLP